MRAFHIIVLYSFSYMTAAVDIYIDAPVKILDCRRSRQDDQWTIGSKEATTQMTEKPADPRDLYNAARDGDIQYIENEISRLGTSGLNLDWQNPDEKRMTALHIAAKQNRPDIVSTLLEAGADPNIKERMKGLTPVFIAAYEGHDRVLHVMLDPKYRADVNLANIYGQTPLYWASRNGLTDALELMLPRGRGDPNKVPDDGTSPLMSASSEGHTACARALLTAGAHVNYVRPWDGRTALHYAAMHNKPDVALVLLKAGASRDIEDTDAGRTPADVARWRNHYSIAEMIDNY